jgi:hypothetical protein
MFPWRREKEKTFRCVKVPILLSSPEVGERAHVALPQANPHVGNLLYNVQSQHRDLIY